MSALEYFKEGGKGISLLFSTDFWFHAGNKALRILLIMIAAGIVQRFTGMVIDRFFIARSGMKTLYFEEKRAKTLSGLLQSVARYIIYFIAIVMVLQEFNIDTTSLIAGAGVVGLALGVGAQSLIRDFVTGFFIILEDQYAIGDYVVSGDMAGTVEEIGLRVTKLRDANGILHIIPNGQISRISNYSRGVMQAVINVPVSYQADLNQVLELLDQACLEVGGQLLEVVEGPKVIGVVDLRPNELIIRIIAKTVPLEQTKVETAVRRQIKLLFDGAHIPPPLTNRVTG